MLDPRIYRMGLLPVLLAVIVLAFSLSDQQGPLSTNLATDAYNGAQAYASMNGLARQYPDRRPGSPGDRALANYIAGQLNGDGFVVSTQRFSGRTTLGTRPLENVIGVRAGQLNGSIVLVSHRDALSSPATADLSGTAVMLQLASVLSGETLQHTIVLASTSGSAGQAGAMQLARGLQQPVDAVIVLGDMAGTEVREPLVVPWSNSQLVAPPVLRNTVSAALVAQASLPGGRTSLLGQIAHLAFPLAATGQAPFGSSGDPAVLLSLSGEQPPAPDHPTSPAQITSMGRALLQAVTAVDGGPTLPGPSSYLTISGKSVPAWAVRVLVLALVLPVLGATIDGIARARRRGSWVLRWTMWVVSAAVPFVLAVLVVKAARAVGWISAAPPGPLSGDAVQVHSGEIAWLAGLLCLILAGLVWLRRSVVLLAGLRDREHRDQVQDPGPAAGVMLVLCVVALAVWLTNPFAALLLVPALHLWLWIVVPDVRVPAPAMVVLLVAGLALPALVVVQYATTLGLGPLQAAWGVVLLLAGGGLGFLAALEWCLFLGCVVTVVVLAWRAARERRPQAAPVTVRGPATYAGPGSLGGTESALRR